MSANATKPVLHSHCFADEKSQKVLNSGSLDVAYKVFTVFCFATIAMYIIKIFWDDTGESDEQNKKRKIRAIRRTVPVIALGVAYALATWVPQACVSPLAFGHWFVSGLGWTAVVFSVCLRAQFKKHRVYIFVLLDAYVSLSFAAATYWRNDAFMVLLSAILVCFMLHVMSKNKDTLGKSVFRSEHDEECDEEDMDEETFAQKRLKQLVELKLFMTFVIFMGLRYFGSTVVVILIGIAEVNAILLGMPARRSD